MVRYEILLINDGSFLLRMMAKRLDNQGYSTWLADSPDEVMEILRYYDFDLVVIKLSEEDADRLAILFMVKIHCPETKLVIISESEFLPLAVFEAVFDDYIGLPCSPSKLWRQLAIFLEEPIAPQQKELFLHPANYRVLHRLVVNLEKVYQNLREGEADLRILEEKAACRHPGELAANLESTRQKNSQAIFLLEKILSNFKDHDFFQEQVDCYDI